MGKRIAGFDGLRAIASVAVVFCHTVAGRTQIGGYAVNLFFALSGFLILSILYDTRRSIERRETAVGTALGNFWTRRFARICPVYYVVLAFALPWLVLNDEMPLWHVPAYIAYLQNYLILWTAEWGAFGYTWTLAVEQQFYVLSAALLLLTPSERHRPLLGAAAIGLLVLALILGQMPWLISAFSVDRLPLVGFSMASAGGWLALSWRDGRSFGGWLRFPSFVVATAICAVLAPMPAGWLNANPITLFAQPIVQLVAICVILGHIVTHQESLVVRFLDHRILKFYGAISYSLYLCHGFLADQLKPYWFEANLGIGVVNFAVERLTYFAFILGISTIIATLLWKYVERVFHKSRPAVPAAPLATA
ncbi:acyltransferase family protein [Sphingomonas hankookensis]|uniref:acyltransferase family protein n=1 Tax=Sphingomonas hankookensis TaxID=563996 RepID=UPI002412DC3E|nr:acyltransferase [Sphingomonas hankookensis]